MFTGVFSEVFLCAGFSVEVRQYFHRELSRLMVAEIVVKRITSTETIIVSVHVNHGLNSNDISFVKHEGCVFFDSSTHVFFIFFCCAVLQLQY